MRAIFLAVVFLFAGAARAQFDLNDISLLLPLPRNGEESLMWSPRTQGGQGPLLPGSVFSVLPRITMDLDQQSLYEKYLKVVSIRLDPCFHEGAAPAPCQRQIRLVWQPLVFEGGAWTTLDAAMHTFYVLNDSEWQQLLAALAPANGRSPTAGLPLQMHPILAREGFRGPFWQRLAPILLKSIGERRLVRATAMVVNPLGTVWFFTGVNVASGKTAAIPIPRIGDATQGFFANSERDDVTEFRAAMSPAPEEEPLFKALLKNSRAARVNLSPAELQAAARSALQMENPRLHNPGTMDCASCHAAHTVSAWAAKNFPQWNWSQLFGPDFYRGLGNPANTTVGPGRVKVLRAFGYFDRDPIVAPRTVNETSEALRMILQTSFFRGR